MKACIYVRTCRQEREHHTTSVDNQIAFCRDLAYARNLTVDNEHIFTDAEKRGDLLPTCWAANGADSRPALSAMIAAIEAGEVARILVRRLEKLGTSSEGLTLLRDLLTRHDVWIVAAPEPPAAEQDQRSLFAFSILKPRVLAEADYERDKREAQKSKKHEELRRLQARVARLEAELAAM